MHSSTPNSSILSTDDTSKYLWVKGESTIIYELSEKSIVKLVEMYQPNINTSASVAGCSNFAMYGSNDNSSWTEINNYLACKRGLEASWYNKSMTTHITRIDDSDYSVPSYKYIKLVVSSYTEWTCVGIARFYK